MSALVQLNGLPVTQATVHLPRVGVWHAQVALEQLDAFDGQRATLQFGPNLSLTGAVRRSGSADGHSVLILIGGAGKLVQSARAQAYRQAPLRVPLNDLLTEAEETLAASAQNEILNLQLPNWVVPALPIGLCLGVLLGYAAAAWRILPEGTFWVGNETWPDAPSFDHLILTELPLHNGFSVYSDEPAVLPGQTFEGKHVSYVQHVMHEDELETTVYSEAA